MATIADKLQGTQGSASQQGDLSKTTSRTSILLKTAAVALVILVAAIGVYFAEVQYGALTLTASLIAAHPWIAVGVALAALVVLVGGVLVFRMATGSKTLPKNPQAATPNFTAPSQSNNSNTTAARSSTTTPSSTTTTTTIPQNRTDVDLSTSSSSNSQSDAISSFTNLREAGSGITNTSTHADSNLDSSHMPTSSSGSSRAPIQSSPNVVVTAETTTTSTNASSSTTIARVTTVAAGTIAPRTDTGTAGGIIEVGTNSTASPQTQNQPLRHDSALIEHSPLRFVDIENKPMGFLMAFGTGFLKGATWGVVDYTGDAQIGQLSATIEHVTNRVKRANEETAKRCAEQTRLYVSNTSKFRSKDLLGNFDVLGVLCTMDYLDTFAKNKTTTPSRPFWAHQGVVPSIGTSKVPNEVDSEYFNQGHLKTDKFLRDLRRVYHNVMNAQALSGVTDAIWLPHGAYGNLQFLSAHDADYKDPQKTFELRQSIVEVLVDEIDKSPIEQFHIILLPESRGMGLQCYNAVVNEVLKYPRLHRRMTFYINKDEMLLAQELTNSGQNISASIAMSVGRHVIGGGWMDDSNIRLSKNDALHIRSIRAATTAFWLNGGHTNARERAPDELINRVLFLGGTVTQVD